MKPLQIICLKWGNKYPAYYANRLYSMIERFTQQPFKLYCITEHPRDLYPDIGILPITDPTLSGWWHKLSLFKANLYDLQGPVLFIDLDIVITADLSPFFDYQPGKFVIINDRSTGGYNSSVFRLEAGSKAHVWNNFASAANDIVSRYHGDQDWITEQITDAEIWPDNWVVSFKKDCNARVKHSFGMVGRWLRSLGMLTPKGYAELPAGARIIQFHGKPDPGDVMDTAFGNYKQAPWIKDYWKEKDG